MPPSQTMARMIKEATGVALTIPRTGLKKAWARGTKLVSTASRQPQTTASANPQATRSREAAAAP